MILSEGREEERWPRGFDKFRSSDPLSLSLAPSQQPTASSQLALGRRVPEGLLVRAPMSSQRGRAARSWMFL